MLKNPKYGTFSSAFSSRYAKTRTSNFRKVVRQHTEGLVGSIIWVLFGNLPGFPAVKELWKSVKSWQSLVYYYFGTRCSCGCCVKCSSDKKQCDVGVKLSQAYLHNGQCEQAVSLCERLMDVTDDDVVQLSLSRVIASAAAASPRICTDNRRLFVSSFCLTNHTFVILSVVIYNLCQGTCYAISLVCFSFCVHVCQSVCL